MDRIDILRMVHVTSAVLLLGHVTVTGFWALFLYRQRSVVPFRQVARAILWSDMLFALLGSAGLIASGILLAVARGYPVADTPWLFRGVVILAATTFLWLVVLLPDQRRMERAIMGDYARLRRLFLRWSLVGWASTAALFWAMWGMVSRQ
ncbi:MAG: DUF2269 family protein [Gemmatimonadota bacterium]